MQLKDVPKGCEDCETSDVRFFYHGSACISNYYSHNHRMTTSLGEKATEDKSNQRHASHPNTNYLGS